ncbi:hypothetical protein MCUN1_003624 [Malassezia cuniculi]|uniref:Dolichyldiphosphatase n=1 Tax=Malassezia cuniculi TaxID=948313 RepID=A0AAF0EXX0_9BASI|nr:hypothetical protein MCUN1_003624 [Malassezia cuniculi]
MRLISPELLTTLDLTHVQYRPDDPYGAYLALVTLAPVLILTSYVAVFLVRREVVYLNALLGQVVTEIVNGKLKRYIKQARPTEFLGLGYGMPSSHAQFCGFFVVFWTCHLLFHRPDRKARMSHHVDSFVFVLLIWLFGVLTCYSRVHLYYHTSLQVLVGGTIGSIIGALYYAATEAFVRAAPAGSVVHSARHFFYTNSLSRALHLRDGGMAWEDAGAAAEYATWFSKMTASPGGILTNGSLACHVRMMLLALTQADDCDAVKGAFSVGCAIAVPALQLADPEAPIESLHDVEPRALTTGFSREFPGNTHAEECAIEKLARYCVRTPGGQGGAAIDMARSRAPIRLLLYTTMEPCSERLSGNKPCVARILETNAQPMYTTCKWLAKLAASIPENAGVSPVAADDLLRPVRIDVVLQGVPEPDDFVKCVGQRTLRMHGIHVVTVTPESSPSAIGVSLPNLASVPIAIDTQQPTGWLREACLCMARKGHKDA